jgi:hypothetical protein
MLSPGFVQYRKGQMFSGSVISSHTPSNSHWIVIFFLWRYRPNLDLGLPPWNSPFRFGRTPCAGDQFVARSIPVHTHKHWIYMPWLGFKPTIPASERAKSVHTLKVGRTPACVKTCNSQDTMSATWLKERSIVETNEITKSAAHRSESWCWLITNEAILRILSHVLMLVLAQLVCSRP